MITGMLLIGSVLAMAQPAEYGTEGCAAWLERSPKSGSVQIEAYCKCKENGEVSYKMTTTSSGSSGSSSSTQQGIKLLQAEIPDLLAQVTLGGMPSRSYEVTLDIYRNGVHVAKAVTAASTD